MDALHIGAHKLVNLVDGPLFSGLFEVRFILFHHFFGSAARGGILTDDSGKTARNGAFVGVHRKVGNVGAAAVKTVKHRHNAEHHGEVETGLAEP